MLQKIEKARRARESMALQAQSLSDATLLAGVCIIDFFFFYF